MSSFGGVHKMIKMERSKGMIVGFSFLIIALCLKGAYAGEYSFIFGCALAVFIAVGPTILSHKLKSNKIES